MVFKTKRSKTVYIVRHWNKAFGEKKHNGEISEWFGEPNTVGGEDGLGTS